MSISRSAAAALLLLCAGPAAAHVTLEVQQAPANTLYRGVFRVPYGCDGAATTRLIIRLPESITQARPMPKPGWTLRTTLREDAPAAVGHGVARELAEVVFEGGRLEDAHYDEFVVRFQLPDRAGDVLYIPVVQECEGGTQAAWVEIPEPGRRVSEYRFLAPALRLLPRR
jgi:uncharacterized protein YcnI